MPGDEKMVGTLMADLFPLSRSITGDGTRATLRRIGAEIPLDVYEVPSGAPVLDWTVPDEWNLHRAVLRDPAGEMVVDTADNNLHVVNYSEPVRGEFDLAELSLRLYSLPDRPTLIPYRTSYYHRTWGFCLSDERRAVLGRGRYQVDIDVSLGPGALTYGELLVPGRVPDEVLVSTHVCHPNMANDNLTGIAAAVTLACWALRDMRRLTYRFLFVPATIGALAWLAAHKEALPPIAHGLVLTGLGDTGPLVYKRSRRGDAPVDQAMTYLVRGRGTTVDWYPYGYDERQYCSPGFDLPVGRLTRAVHGTYPEYHTSGDNLSFVRPEQVVAAADVVLELFDILETGLVPRNLSPYGEPQLGRRDLYRRMGGTANLKSAEMAYLWVLSLADGGHDLMEIAGRAGLPLPTIVMAAQALRAVGLLDG
ncbi:MAG: DUF4910 domain-containing protein [Pseudonocardiales bacterium]|nr:DUF4910 domain-containing protein [Pseudonocardiales bacterium]